ncbi:hypothetical protein B0H14DRAFT_2583290 [Mycena olivaceomarginata]|nr:hypothetical protein B0H14DRAFT_2583290 [Mycena olivaceomarginata]
MAESDGSVKRSGAIHSSADLLYQLIEEENAYAIKPYKDTLAALQSHLSRQLNEHSALMQSAQSLEKELDTLKGILVENELAVESISSGRASLHFIGDSAKLVANLADEIKRFAPEPSQPLSPVSLVHALTQCCVDHKRRLAAAYWRYTNASTERDHLKRTVALRDATLESETDRWSAERAKLEADLKEEQAKAVALITTLAELQKQNQATNARLLTAESESKDWEVKYHALDTEYQSLADVKADLVEQAQAAKTELAQWTTKATVWEADQRQHEDQTARLSQLQSELLRLESLLRDANAERHRLETTLREDNARALAENDTLAAELKELKRKHIERAPGPGSAAHPGSALVRKSAAEAAPSGSGRPLREGSMVAQPKKSARRSHPGFGSNDVMRTGAPSRPDLFPPASTSSISKGLSLSSVATTLPPLPESTHEPSQPSISL